MQTKEKKESSRMAQILNGAARLFCEKGYHETSLKDISEEVGLSSGNIYYYIKSKEEILYRLHNSLGEINDRAHHRIMARPYPPVEKLVEMIKSEFEVMSKHEPLAMLMYQESHVLGPRFRKIILERERKHISLFEKVIRDGITEGALKECNVRMMSNMIKVLIDGWIIKRWDLRRLVSPQDYVKNIIDMILTMISGDDEVSDAGITNKAVRTNETALVTGVSVKMGQYISRKLGQDGFFVAMQNEHKEENLKLLHEFKSVGVHGKGFAMELFSSEHISQLVEKVKEEFKRIGVLVHLLDPIFDSFLTVENKTGWENLITGVVRNTGELFREIGAVMKPFGGGKIVLISGPFAIEGRESNFMEPMESVIDSLVKGWARDFAPIGISVNGISVSSDVVSRTSSQSRPNEKEQIVLKSPNKKLEAVFEDIVKGIRFFVEAVSMNITGEVIHIRT